MKKIIYLPLLATLFISCWNWKTIPPEPPPPPKVKVLGYVPIYSDDANLYAITADTPRQMKSAGKIYVKDNLIFQNDFGYGIHVFDKTNPAVPKNIGFINLRGNLEMSIKGNYMYANSYQDLVVVDISNWRQLREVNRIKYAFTVGSQAYANNPYIFIPLPEKNVYFQCVDINKGVHIGWKKDSIYNYESCYYR